MKLITFLLIHFINFHLTDIYITPCKNTTGSYSKLISQKSTELKKNKDLLISIILNTNLIDYNTIIEMSNDELKKLLIKELIKRTNESVYKLNNKTKLELASFCLAYTFLKTASIKSESELKEMSFIDIRNSIIIENTKNLDQDISTLQTFTTKKLVQLGYSWYLPKKFNSLISFDIVENSSSSLCSKFQLKDNLKRRMDVLKIVKTNEILNNSFVYLAVYHVEISKNNFNLQLAGSNDLFE